MITIDISSSLEGLNPERVARAVKEGLKIGIITLQGKARKESPIDTGFLRNHIMWVESALGWTQTLNSGAEYSYAVHEGVRGRRGNPYFTRALELEKDNILDIIKTKVTESLGS